jgi:hypothetical protein
MSARETSAGLFMFRLFLARVPTVLADDASLDDMERFHPGHIAEWPGHSQHLGGDFLFTVLAPCRLRISYLGKAQPMLGHLNETGAVRLERHALSKG